MVVVGVWCDGVTVWGSGVKVWRYKCSVVVCGGLAVCQAYSGWAPEKESKRVAFT